MFTNTLNFISSFFLCFMLNNIFSCSSLYSGYRWWGVGTTRGVAQLSIRKGNQIIHLVNSEFLQGMQIINPTF